MLHAVEKFTNLAAAVGINQTTRTIDWRQPRDR
jgi:hypothetical protein